MAQNSIGNTAGRVLSLLQHASGQPQNRSARQIWATVLECEQGDTVEIYGRLRLMRYAIDRIQKDVASSSHLKSGHLLVSHFTNIRRAIEPNNLDQSWGEFVQHLRNGELVALEILANELPSEEEISRDERNEIEKVLSDLIEKIRSSDLDLPLRLWALDLLEALRRSLHEYSLRGAHGLQTAISSIIGELGRHANELKPRKDEWWLKELWELVLKVDTKVEQALKSQTLRLTYRAIKARIGLPDFSGGA